MYKKKLCLLTTTIALAAVVGCATFSNLNNVNFSAFGTTDNHNHTVIFSGSDVTPDSYDGGSYQQCFSLSKNNSIVVNDSEKYGLASFDGFTYYMGSDIVTWGGTNIATIEESEGFESFTFYFELVDRANLDLDKSVVDYYVDGKYQNVKFELDTDDPGFNYYAAEFNCYSDYGKKIEVKQVKLVFSC